MVKLSRPGLLAACLGLSSLFKVSRGAVSHALLACSLSLALIGCAGEEASSTDETSPDHIIKAPKSQGKYRFGVTDTIAVEFTENIDTAALDVEFSDPGAAYRITGLRKAILFGTRKTFETSHFTVNTPFTLTLRGLRDPVGNGRPDIEDAFLPYPWVDRDAIDTSFDGYDTLYNGTAWVDGTPVTDTLLIEGSLDANRNFGNLDHSDYKVLRVRAPDTLEVLLRTRKDLDLRIAVAGPFSPDGFADTLAKYNFVTAPTTGEGTRVHYRDTVLTSDQGRLSKTVVTELKDHFRVFNSFDAVGLYVVRLNVPEGEEGFYRLGVRIRKFQ